MLCIDLFCGLGGWAEGFLAEGYDVIGFDIERHRYPKVVRPESALKLEGNNGGAGSKIWSQRPVARLKDVLRGCEVTQEWVEYPGQLVLQDVLTLHGSQFRKATVIVASPPCQAYSYRAMPWKRAKALPPPDNTLFDACFRIQREASEAAGRYIPLVVENVCGAQKWVGRAKWHFGSFYLWGDVPALMPLRIGGVKVPGLNWSRSDKPGYVARAFNTTAEQGIKGKTAAWFNDHKQNGVAIAENDRLSYTSSRSSARKQASAEIAKIPFDLANHIARVYKQST